MSICTYIFMRIICHITCHVDMYSIQAWRQKEKIVCKLFVHMTIVHYVRKGSERRYIMGMWKIGFRLFFSVVVLLPPESLLVFWPNQRKRSELCLALLYGEWKRERVGCWIGLEYGDDVLTGIYGEKQRSAWFIRCFIFDESCIKLLL